MRYLTIVTLLALGSCGDDPPVAPDLAVAVDLAAPADLTAPLDLLPAPDLLSVCNMPKPILYREIVQYTFNQAGGTPTQAASITSVSVDNLGRILRPKGPLTSPSLFHCSFTEKDIDITTCTAPCCPSTPEMPQPVSPVVFVDANGWAVWMTGSCVFTYNNAQYIGSVTDINTFEAH